jgi:hypothetical protein
VELIVGLLAGGAGTVVSLLAVGKQRRTRARIWREAADRVGLTAITQPAGGVFSRAELSARSGPLAVRLERGRQKEHRTRLTVSGLGHGAHGAGGLSLRRKDLGAALQRLLGGDIAIGSPAFDQAISIQGEAVLALAVLDAETRHRLAGLLGGVLRGERVRAALRDGVLEVCLWERGRGLSARALADVIGGVLDVARRLTAPADLAPRIAENLRAEPEEGVRLQCVLALARRFPHHPATREALLAARLDPSDEVRLQAAIALGGSAARQAIAEIQARLTHAEPGQLSLAGDAGDGAGALSLAGDGPGQLSLTADEPSPSHATPAAVQTQ